MGVRRPSVHRHPLLGNRQVVGHQILLTGTYPPYLQTIFFVFQNFNFFIFYDFLALLCATAQQSYCRHAGVRRPSVKPVFKTQTRHADYNILYPVNNLLPKN